MPVETTQFPIGKFNWNETLTPETIGIQIFEIESLPDKLRTIVFHLNDEQLDTPYRPGGWTVRQVIHHLPDSHMNAYIRFKLALTENSPLIKTYKENKWAELPDSFSPVDVSLDLLSSLHYRWVLLLRAMSDDDFELMLTHPDHGDLSLRRMLSLYAWHGEHHLAHITTLMERMGWR